MEAKTELTKELATVLLKQLRPIDLSLGIKLLCGSPLMPRPNLERLLQPEARLFWLAALTNLAQSQSHSGLYLDASMLLVDCFDSPEGSFADTEMSIVELLGDGEELCESFPDYVVCADTLEQHPQVYFVYRPENKLIYLQRWYRMEAKVGSFVRERLQRDALSLPVGFDREFQQFFPPADLVDNPWQAAACLAALRHDFAVITGGPGTGKTTTVTRLIGLLLSLPEAQRPASIQMVAPTGKAAERMREAFADNFQQMLRTLPEPLQAQLSERGARVVQDSSTIHAFLGSRGSRGLTYHAGNPVSCDVLIVDESSMIDLELFIALLDALPGNCRIILLGDKNQLAAVGTGNVFTDLTGTTEATYGNLNLCSEDFHALFERMTTVELPSYSGAPALCRDHVVELTKSYRFTSDSRVGQLARLLLDESRFPEENETSVPCIHLEDDWQTPLIDAVAGYKTCFNQGGSVETLLNAIAQVRILCAVRGSDYGVEAINHLLSEVVLGTGVNPSYPQDGLPFMIRSNDKTLGLANGDCGVFRSDATGELFAYLPPSVGDGEIRVFNPFAIPDWEAAFALTIHKSQGSEYPSVFVVLPEMERKFISWELVYTAITRGKKEVTLVLPRALQGQALERVQRRSGLRQELLNF
jgi:exodeoxyribonuclease V alpha subunit